jgi:competence protein ComEA
MRRVTDLLRNLLGLDDGTTTSLAALEDSGRRVRWKIGVGASFIVGMVAIVITIAVSSIASLGSQGSLPDEFVGVSDGQAPLEQIPTPGRDIFVHVVGAVHAPGLYGVGPDARVIDAVMAAGGLIETADPCAINLAHPIKDGQQIVVPATPDGAVGDEALCFEKNAVGVEVLGSDPRAGGTAALVSLGTAGVAELDTLPGIGPALAQRIIDWREATGGYTSIEQLSEVSGIGDKVMANIRDLVTL